MGAGVKWGKLAFDDRQQLADRRPIGFEGEMDGNGWLFVARAHPKIIGADGSDLRNQQMRTNLVAQPLYGKNGLDGMTPGDEIFGLEFVPSAGGKAHTKVR